MDDDEAFLPPGFLVHKNDSYEDYLPKPGDDLQHLDALVDDLRADVYDGTMFMGQLAPGNGGGVLDGAAYVPDESVTVSRRTTKADSVEQQLIDELRNKIASLEHEKDRALTEKLQSELQVAELQQQNLQFDKRLSRLEQEKSSLATDLEHSNATIASQRQANESKLAKLQTEHEDALSELESALTELEQSREGNDEQLSKLKDDHHAAQASLLEQLDLVRLQLQEAEAETKRLVSTHDHEMMLIRNEKEQLERQVESAKQQTHDDKENLALLEKEVQGERSNYQSKIQQLQDDLEFAALRSNERQAKLESELRGLKEQKSQAEQSLSSLETQLNEAKESLLKAASVKAACEQTIQDLQLCIGEYREAEVTLGHSESKSDEMTGSLEKQVEALRAEVREKEDIVSGLKQKVESAAADIVSNSSEIETLQSALADRKKKVRHLQRRNGALEFEVEAAQKAAIEGSQQDKATIRSLQRRLGAVESDLEESRYQYKETMEDSLKNQLLVRQLQDRITALESVLSAKEHTLEDEKVNFAALSQLQSEIERLRHHGDELKQECEQLHDKVNLSNQQLEAAKERHSFELHSLTLSSKNEIQQLESQHDEEINRLHLERERFATVARRAVDDTNEMIQNEFQRIKVNATKQAQKEAARSFGAMEERLRVLEEDLIEALEREDEHKETFEFGLGQAQEQIRSIQTIHNDAMNHLKEQYDLIEEELFDALNREDDYQVERVRFLEQQSRDREELQQSKSQAQQQIMELKKTVSTLEETLQEKKSNRLDQVAALQQNLEDQSKTFEKERMSMQQKLETLQAHAASLTSVADNDDDLANKVALFQECRAYFMAELAAAEQTTTRNHEARIRDMEEEHLVSNVALFRSFIIYLEAVISKEQDEPTDSSLSPVELPNFHSAAADDADLPKPAASLAASSTEGPETIPMDSSSSISISPSSAFVAVEKTEAKRSASSSSEVPLNIEKRSIASDSNIDSIPPRPQSCATTSVHAGSTLKKKVGATMSTATKTDERIKPAVSDETTDGDNISDKVKDTVKGAASSQNIVPEKATAAIPTTATKKFSNKSQTSSASPKPSKSYMQPTSSVQSRSSKKSAIVSDRSKLAKGGSKASSRLPKRSGPSSSLQPPKKRSALSRPSSTANSVLKSRPSGRTKRVTEPPRALSTVTNTNLSKNASGRFRVVPASKAASGNKGVKRDVPETKMKLPAQKSSRPLGLVKPKSRVGFHTTKSKALVGQAVPVQKTGNGATRQGAETDLQDRNSVLKTPKVDRGHTGEALYSKLKELQVVSSTPLVSSASISRIRLSTRDTSSKIASASKLPKSLKFNLTSTAKKLNVNSVTSPDRSLAGSTSTHLGEMESIVWNQPKTSGPTTPSIVPCTPLRVGMELYDMLSPSSPLVTPAKPKPPPSTLNLSRTNAKDKEEKSMERAAIVLQKVHRGWKQRRLTEEYKGRSVCAATILQCQWRSSQARASRKTAIKAVLVLQCFSRQRLAAKKRTEKKKLLRAAILIQATYRGHLSRLQRSYKSIRCSAILIQSLFRMKLSRRIAAERKADKIRIQTEASSVDIQSFWRMKAKQLEFVSMRSSTILLQSAWRGKSARLLLTRLRQEQHSSIKIQSFLRMKTETAKFTSTLASVRVIQSHWHGAIVRKSLAVSKKATLKIQTIWRAYSQRRKFIAMCDTVIRIQACFRGVSGRKETFRRKQRSAAATQIQSVFRIVKAKQTANFMRGGVVTIQAVARGYIFRTYVDRLKLQSIAVIHIQSAFRMVRVRQHILSMHRNAITIQALARGVMDRGVFNNLRRKTHAVTRIQSFFRMAKVLHWHNRLCRSTLILQALARGKMERQRVEEIRRRYLLHQTASVCLQTWWRSKAAQQSYCIILASIVKVQSAIRVFLAKSTAARLKTEKEAAIETSPSVPVASSRQSTRSTRSNKPPPFAPIAPPRRPVLGDLTGPTTHTRVTRSNATVRRASGNENSRNSKPQPTKQAKKSSASKPAPLDADSLRALVEKMKVVDLREELKRFGLESKDYRSLRKAALVDLVVSQRIMCSNS